MREIMAGRSYTRSNDTKCVFTVAKVTKNKAIGNMLMLKGKKLNVIKENVVYAKSTLQGGNWMLKK